MYTKERIYTRRILNIGEKEHYYISFKDSVGSTVEVEVEKGVYDAMREFELIDARIARSDKRHVEHFELSDSEIETRAIREPETTENAVLSRALSDEIVSAIDSMPALQRNRFLLFRSKGLTLKEIADREGRCSSAIHYSIKCAERKIKNVYKKFSEETEL